MKLRFLTTLQFLLFLVATSTFIPATSHSASLQCKNALKLEKLTLKEIASDIQAIRTESNSSIEFTIADSTKLRKALKVQLKVSASEFAQKDLESGVLKLNDVVDLAVQKIDSLEIAAHKKSDMWIEFYRDNMQGLISKMTAPKRKAAKFTIAKAALDLESFRADEFKRSDYLSIVNKNMLYVHIEDFLDITRSYIDGTSLYQKIPDSGHGILDFKDIRDIESHNMFPVEYKGHDIRHVHYSTGHPYVIGMVWPAARSKNHVRYVLMGGLFEGVDSVQYWWEQKLTSHFRNKGFKLEEALVEIGLMTTAELNKLSEKVGAQYVVSEMKDWKPTSKGQYSAFTSKVYKSPF